MRIKVRGRSYLPLELQQKKKAETFKKWKDNFRKELPKFWQRHLMVSSKQFSGYISYDGNYFDLFEHSLGLYVLGHFFEVILICRIAAEQALLRLLEKHNQEKMAYKKNGRLKSLEDLVGIGIYLKLFKNFNKDCVNELNKIAKTANNLNHIKFDLNKEDQFERKAKTCLAYLNKFIKIYLNYMKDTGITGGFKLIGLSKRLR